MKLNSIKVKTAALFSILGVVTISIFVVLAYRNMKAGLESEYNIRSELVLKHTRITFHDQFVNALNALEQLSQKENAVILPSDKSKCVSLLKMFQKMVPYSTYMEFGSERGDACTGPDRQIPPGYDPRERSWYLAAKAAEGEIIWTEPYLDYITQKIVITAARAVISQSGRLEGVISVHFDVSTISGVISNSKVGSKGFVMLLSKKGAIVANKEDFMIGERIFGDGYEELLIHGKPDSLEYKINKAMFKLKYDIFSENGMVLVTAVSKNEIDEELGKALEPIMITGIVCLLVFGTLAYIFALKGISPLQRLVSMMQDAEKGNYHVHEEFKEYEEINKLSQNFNNMIGSIQRRDSELMASNMELAATEEELRKQYNKLKRSQQVLKESEERITRLAFYDPLTGLANREKLIEDITEALGKSIDDNSDGALIYMDLDNFKTINDTLGHTIGDKVLIEISQKFKMAGKYDKTVARIGGDEFIMLVKGVDSPSTLVEICSSIIDLFNEPVIVESKNFNLTASLGVVLFPVHGKTVEELMKKADMAMYKAKNKGKNCYQIFDERMEMEIRDRLDLENELRDAIASHEFSLHYQPQYRLPEKSVSGMEALLRWNSKSFGNISPSKFIKIAEETGMIVGIEKWVLTNACIFARNINRSSSKAVKVSVNISSVHIMQSNFVKNVMDIINEMDVNPQLIELEITETVMMDSFVSNKRKLQELRKLGIKIHLDDFGTGYSSLSYLQNLPIDYVKIDKSFIDTMLNSSKGGKITATMVELAHNIGLKVIAEGVEKEEQMALLSKYKCDIVQGFYLGRPVPEEDIFKLLQC